VGSSVISLADGHIAHPATVPVSYEEDAEDKKVLSRVPWMDAEKGMCLVSCASWDVEQAEERLRLDP